MATAVLNVQFSGLGKSQIAALTRRAKRMGLTPDRYIERLVERDLAPVKPVPERARRRPRRTFREIMGPGEPVNPARIVALVKKIRAKNRSQR